MIEELNVWKDYEEGDRYYCESRFLGDHCLLKRDKNAYA